MNTLARRLRARRNVREFDRVMRTAATPAQRQELMALAALNWR